MASELSNLIEHELKSKGFYQNETDEGAKKAKGPRQDEESDEENQNHDATSTLMGAYTYTVRTRSKVISPCLH